MCAAPLQRSRPVRDKRKTIPDAAVRVFADRGYHGSRVSDIAREAGIAYGLVYHYFRNKEEILDTIFEEHGSGFLEAVEDIAGGAPRESEYSLRVARTVVDIFPCGLARQPEGGQ